LRKSVGWHADIHTTEIYEKIRLDEPWDSEYNKEFHKRIEWYQCPSRSYSSDRNCNYSRFTGEKMLPELTINNEKHFWAIIDVQEPFCWMNPMADISFDELLKNVEQVKDDEESLRIYLRHRTTSVLLLLKIGVKCFCSFRKYNKFEVIQSQNLGLTEH
jgi:hypothetical protein